VRKLPAFLAALVLALGLVACDGEAEDVAANPTQALRDAISALAEWDGAQITLSVTGSQEAWRALTDGEITDDIYDLVTDSSLVVRAAGADEQGEFQLAFNLGNDTVLDMRAVQERFFVSVDPEPLVTTFGGDADVDLDDFVAQAQLFGMADVAAAVRDGGWIEVTGLQEFADFFAGFAQNDELDETDIAALQARLAAALDRFIDQETTVTAVGSEAAGERVRVQTTGAALERLFEEFGEIAGEAAGFGDMGDFSGEFEGEFSDVGTVTLDVWIQGGELSQIGIDLAHFDDLGRIQEGDAFVLIGLEEFGGGVDVPNVDAELNLFDVMGMFFGGFGDFDDFDFGDDDFDFGDDDFDFGDDFDEPECVTEDELESMSEEDRAIIEAFIEAGFLEVC
jgi:hypothetical protein